MFWTKFSKFFCVSDFRQKKEFYEILENNRINIFPTISQKILFCQKKFGFADFVLPSEIFFNF